MKLKCTQCTVTFACLTFFAWILWHREKNHATEHVLPVHCWISRLPSLDIHSKLHISHPQLTIEQTLVHSTDQWFLEIPPLPNVKHYSRSQTWTRTLLDVWVVRWWLVRLLTLISFVECSFEPLTVWLIDLICLLNLSKNGWVLSVDDKLKRKNE